MDVNPDSRRPLALTRRGFLMGAVALTAAGCGGGDSSTSEEFWGTYRGGTRTSDVAAGLTVGRDDRVTYWTLYYDPTNELFADFGQSVLFDDRFTEVAGGVRTYATFFGDRASGRTEEAANRNNGYNWNAYLAGRPTRERPGREFIGSWSGSARRDNIDADILLHVDDEGNATFFGAFDDLDVGDAGDPAEFYAFESLSIDSDGTGYNYYFDFEGNRISLDDLSGENIRLLYRFSEEFIDLEGVVFEVTLTRTSRSAPVQNLKRPVGVPRAGSRPLGKLRRK